MESRLTYAGIVLLMLISACYKEQQITQTDVIVSMTGNKSSITADGVSKQLITVQLPDKTTDANNSVVFTTTKGLFDVVAKNTVTVTAQNTMVNGQLQKIASAYLVSTTDEGPAYVTATVKNYSQTDTINFSRAYPEQIHLNVDKLNYQLSNTGEVTVTIQTKRNPGEGTPSTAQAVTLTALDNTQANIGSFRNLTLVTDVSGNCVNYFSMPLGSTYTGTVTFKASVQTDVTGKTNSDSQTINIYK